MTEERAMTEDKSFKRRVRERMSKTGESYATARSHVAQKRDRNRAARTRLAVFDDRVPTSAIQKATGKTWDVVVPDPGCGGEHRRRRTPSTFEVREARSTVFPGWWSQSVTVGLRAGPAGCV